VFNNKVNELGYQSKPAERLFGAFGGHGAAVEGHLLQDAVIHGSSQHAKEECLVNDDFNTVQLILEIWNGT
jgi:hypothetical protein